MSDITEFLTARYDELERMAADRLCISCLHPVKERYVTEFGLREWRGYEHDERRDSTGRMHRWQGVRCEGGMTGAEPVQRPDLVLADLAAKRAIAAGHRCGSMVEERDETECITCSQPSEGFSGLWPVAYPCTTMRLLAAPYAECPHFDPAWRIDG